MRSALISVERLPDFLFFCTQHYPDFRTDHFASYRVPCTLVVVVLTLTHPYNVVSGHRTVSNNAVTAV